MNSPFLFVFVSNWRPVPPVISIVTFAPSTGWPLSSLTTPLTMPVDCASAGIATRERSKDGEDSQPSAAGRSFVGP